MSEKSWVSEEHVLFGGHVVVFTTTTSKKPNYQVRISLPGEKGYQKRKSLKTTKKSEAIHLASELYLEMRARQSQGLTLQKYTWNMLVAEYLATRTHEIYTRQFHSFNDRYFAPFFNQYETIESIDDDKIQAFWSWRIDYWKTHRKAWVKEKNKGRVTNIAKEPSYATIQKQRSFLRSIMRYAFERRLIGALPDIKHPYKGDLSRDESALLGKKKRASFDKDAYDSLISKLNGLCKRKNWWRDIQKRQWERLKLAVLLIRESLIRPQELFQLTYREIFLRADGDEQYTLIDIPQLKAKTRRPRVIVCENGDAVYRYVQNFRQWAIHKEDDDLIFSRDSNSQKPVDFNYIWDKLLTEWGLRHDIHGRRRTLYSLRHFGIEQMLLRGVPPLVIAKTAGTSLEMINNFYDETETWRYREHLNKNRTLYSTEDRTDKIIDEIEKARERRKLRLVTSADG